jgi:hypothetical protein
MFTGLSCILVARILDSQGKADSETKEMYERSLAILVRNEGPNGANTADVNTDIGAESDCDKKENAIIISEIIFC